MLKILVLIFISMRVHAEWVALQEGTQIDAIHCSQDLLGPVSESQLWINKRDYFLVCAVEKIPKGLEIMVKPPFHIETLFSDMVTRIASETKLAGRPKKLFFKGENIEITTLWALERPEVFKQIIRCVGATCTVEKPKCVLQRVVGGEKVLTTLNEQMKTTPAKKKLKLWMDYFSSGNNLKNGEAIVIEAMMGNDLALSLVANSVGANSQIGEIQKRLVQDIQDVRKICVLDTH